METGQEGQASPEQVLMTTQSGSIALITSVDEQMYRRLTTMQAHLTTVLEHPCGLNPRAHRAVDSDGFNAVFLERLATL